MTKMLKMTTEIGKTTTVNKNKRRMYWNISTARQGAHQGIVGQLDKSERKQDVTYILHFAMNRQENEDQNTFYI